MSVEWCIGTCKHWIQDALKSVGGACEIEGWPWILKDFVVSCVTCGLVTSADSVRNISSQEWFVWDGLLAATTKSSANVSCMSKSGVGTRCTWALEWNDSIDLDCWQGF